MSPGRQGIDPPGPSAASRVEPGPDTTETAFEVADEPVLSVISGNPTDEELAALTAVVVALRGTGDADSGPGSGRSWLRRTMLRLNPLPGPGSWRRSAR